MTPMDLTSALNNGRAARAKAAAGIWGWMFGLKKR